MEGREWNRNMGGKKRKGERRDSKQLVMMRDLRMVMYLSCIYVTDLPTCAF